MSAGAHGENLHPYIVENDPSENEHHRVDTWVQDGETKCSKLEWNVVEEADETHLSHCVRCLNICGSCEGTCPCQPSMICGATRC